MTSAGGRPGGLALRPATELDLPALAVIHNAAAQADDTGQTESATNLRAALSDRTAPAGCNALTVAELDGQVVGFHRLRSFQEPDGPHIYSHRGWVHPDARGRGVGSMLIEHAERQLTAQFRLHAPAAAALSAWAYQTEQGALRLLAGRGYLRHRTMLEMTRDLSAPLPQVQLPAGLELRPVEPDHLPQIWSAYLEASADDLGAVAGSDATYQDWLALPQWDHSLWQIAWDRGEVAGMVLNHFNAPDGAAGGARRAYTEYVNVRRPWRRRGLASALLVRSMRTFRALGVRDVTLDVNEANPSRAVKLYLGLGYRERRRIAVLRRGLTAP